MLKYWKEIVLNVVFVALFYAFVFTIKPMFFPVLMLENNLIPTIILFVALLCVWAVTAFISQSRVVTLVSAAVAGGLVLFITDIKFNYFLTLAIFGIFYAAAHAVKTDRGQRFKLAFLRSVKAGTTSFVLVLCLTAATMFFSCPEIYSQQSQIKLPAAIESMVLDSMVKQLVRDYPTFHANMTLDQLIYTIIAKQAGFTSSADVERVTQEIKSKTTAAELKKQRETILQAFGLPNGDKYSGNESVKQILTQDIINYYAQRYLGGNLWVVVLVITLLFFEFIYFITKVAASILIYLAALLYKLLLATKFIKIKTKQETVEYLEV